MISTFNGHDERKIIQKCYVAHHNSQYAIQLLGINTLHSYDFNMWEHECTGLKNLEGDRRLSSEKITPLTSAQYINDFSNNRSNCGRIR